MKLQFKKSLCYAVCMVLVITISCKKSAVEMNKATGDADVSMNSVHPVTKVTYPLYLEMSGPFTISPVSATILIDHQDFSFSYATPFPLQTGVVEGLEDVTLPLPDRFYDGTLKFIGKGNDVMVGTATVQTSVFSDPVDPNTGDFYGSEHFTGTFQITGGTGRYLNATGGGTYTAHSDYTPPAANGALFSGFTTLTATGTVSVVPHNGD